MTEVTHVEIGHPTPAPPHAQGRRLFSIGITASRRICSIFPLFSALDTSEVHDPIVAPTGVAGYTTGRELLFTLEIAATVSRKITLAPSYDDTSDPDLEFVS